MSIQPIVTQYQKEDEYAPYYAFTYLNETGTSIEYHVKMECSSLDTIKELLVPAVTNALNETIHPVISTFYNTDESHRFDMDMTDFSHGDHWTLTSLLFRFANHIFKLQVTSKNSYLRYETENTVKNVTMNRLEQHFVDGSSILIKANMLKPIDGKYPVTYKYTKCVESTFEAIQQGCVDLLELHNEHVMIDFGEWTTFAK